MTTPLHKMFLAIGPVVALSLSALFIIPDFSPAAATRKGQAEMRKRVPMTKDQLRSDKELRKELRKKPADVKAPAVNLTKTQFDAILLEILLKGTSGEILPEGNDNRTDINSGQAFMVHFDYEGTDPGHPPLNVDITVNSGFNGTGPLFWKKTLFQVYEGWQNWGPYTVVHPGGSYPIAAMLRVKVYVNPGQAFKWYETNPGNNALEVPLTIYLQ